MRFLRQAYNRLWTKWARYKLRQRLKNRARTWGKMKCWLCKGTGFVFEGDGWGIPMWTECSTCRGTGRYPFALSCGCWTVEGLGYITAFSCEYHTAQYRGKPLDTQVPI